MVVALKDAKTSETEDVASHAREAMVSNRSCLRDPGGDAHPQTTCRDKRNDRRPDDILRPT
jgi:hypothetical protein